MNKAVLWDLDGTLLYTLPDIANASNATLRHFGYPERTLEEYNSFVGNGARNQIRCALGGEPENFEEILQYYREYYTAHCNETTRPYDGIPEVAARLRQDGWRLGIVTNKPQTATTPLYEAFFPDFDLALGERSAVPRKPNPDMVRLALEQLDVTEDRAVYVGDSEVDVLTARNSGLPCISAAWGYRTMEQLLEAGADHICRDPHEIPALLEELFRGK